MAARRAGDATALCVPKQGSGNQPQRQLREPQVAAISKKSRSHRRNFRQIRLDHQMQCPRWGRHTFRVLAMLTANPGPNRFGFGSALPSSGSKHGAQSSGAPKARQQLLAQSAPDGSNPRVPPECDIADPALHDVIEVHTDCEADALGVLTEATRAALRATLGAMDISASSPPRGDYSVFYWKVENDAVWWQASRDLRPAQVIAQIEHVLPLATALRLAPDDVPARLAENAAHDSLPHVRARNLVVGQQLASGVRRRRLAVGSGGTP
jgi:hypothetical protein